MAISELKIKQREVDTLPATLDTTPQPQPLGEIRFNSPGYAYGEMDGGTQQAIDDLTIPHKSP